MQITSVTNPRIKQIVRLKNKKERAASGLIVVDGIREVGHAKGAGIKIKELYTCPIFCEGREVQGLIKEILKKDIPVHETTPAVFEKISFGDRREGILAICQPKQRELSEITLSDNPLIVVVEAPEKPGNLGAILRTCDGAGVDALIVSDATTDMGNPNIIRASLGMVFVVPVVQAANEDVLKFLKSKKVKIVATSPDGDTTYTDANLKEPFALVVGSEQEGLSDFWMRHAGGRVRIPMQGQSDSLNMSASTAVVLFEALRQRAL